jgi:hypothetical protein
MKKMWMLIRSRINGPTADNIIYIKGDKLGVGTTTPSRKLEVSGTTKTDSLIAANIKMTNGAANGYVLQSDASGNATWVSPATSLVVAGNGLSYSADTLNSVWTQSGNNIYNNNGGYVGIGTSTPVAPLHVAGNAVIGSGMYGPGQLLTGSGAE